MIVRKTSGDPISPESIERLKRLAEMPDELIRTDLIPEQRFDLALARERRKIGWTPCKAMLKKASEQAAFQMVKPAVSSLCKELTLIPPAD